MTIHELLEILKKHPNQNAKIEWKINVANPDNEDEDISANVEVFNQDDFYDNFVEIIVVPTKFNNY